MCARSFKFAQKSINKIKSLHFEPYNSDINYLKICHYTALAISGYQSGTGLSDIGCSEVASSFFYRPNRSGLNLILIVRKGTDPAPETWRVFFYILLTVHRVMILGK
jgi:hypothetical protein